MARRHAIIFEDDLRIPEDAHTFDGFERWLESSEFPETGRIDFLAGDVEVDLSPEDVFTHSVVKSAVVLTLGNLIRRKDQGEIFFDRTRLTSRFAELSVEPDVFLLLDASLGTGKARLTPSSRKGRISGIDGAPDLVVEIVSDSSVKKDTKRLPLLYARAGVPELWIIDARRKELRFEIHSLQGSTYESVVTDSEGWLPSPQLGGSFRLTRRRVGHFPWRYTLKHRSKP
ncbi:MAG TPA: Uma2 family endonuclease [Thermoanaerobaculia bacterium]|nr:Uma2 family endonuclease [Thermoanaerobaculia bacterium]